MKLKLSEVGKRKIHLRLLMNEFEQSDFEDVVILTSDDAEEIVQYLWDTVGTINVSQKRGEAIENFIKNVRQVKAMGTKETSGRGDESNTQGISMKLSTEGWSKAEKYLCPECWGESNWERPNEPEFEPEDFKPEIQINPKDPEIRLSIEEAKSVRSALNKLCVYAHPEVAKWAQKLEWMVMDKIEKAGVSKC